MASLPCIVPRLHRHDPRLTVKMSHDELLVTLWIPRRVLFQAVFLGARTRINSTSGLQNNPVIGPSPWQVGILECGAAMNRKAISIEAGVKTFSMAPCCGLMTVIEVDPSYLPFVFRCQPHGQGTGPHDAKGDYPSTLLTCYDVVWGLARLRHEPSPHLVPVSASHGRTAS